jgi:hypothetical protein
MFCFTDILFVILLMYYNVCHIVFWDYNCSFTIFLIICMTISTSNDILLPNEDLRNVNKWWWWWICFILRIPTFYLFYRPVLEKVGTTLERESGNAVVSGGPWLAPQWVLHGNLLRDRTLCSWKATRVAFKKRLQDQLEVVLWKYYNVWCKTLKFSWKPSVILLCSPAFLAVVGMLLLSLGWCNIL